jgi:hypothetical protein
MSANFFDRFRWVACQLDELQKLGQKRRILKALNDLPKTLDDTYNRMLQSIHLQAQDQAVTALHWMLSASRPLQLEELGEVIALNTEDDAILDQDDRLSSSKDALNFLPGLVTSNLTEATKEIVTFSHFTVREYVSSGLIKVGSHEYRFDRAIAHGFVAQLCFRYLLQILDTESAWRQLNPNYPLLHYASTQAFTHSKASEFRSQDLISLVMDFTSQEKRCWETWKNNIRVTYDGDLAVDNKERDSASPLYYMACLGLGPIVKLLIERDGNLNGVGGFYGTPLQAGIGWQHSFN